jgi:hypothetical protein
MRLRSQRSPRFFVFAIRFLVHRHRAEPTRSVNLLRTVRVCRTELCTGAVAGIFSGSPARAPAPPLTQCCQSPLDCWTGRQGCWGDCHPANECSDLKLACHNCNGQ